jgi:hypothetical protein
MGTSGPGIVGGALFVLIYFLIMGGMIAGWVVFVMAAWRGMKAHESVAESLRRIADKKE